MKSKELEVLYLIFELSLKPPFEFGLPFVLGDSFTGFVLNKFKKDIAYFTQLDSDTSRTFIGKRFSLMKNQSYNIIGKVKTVFQIDEMNDSDVEIISFHLKNWLNEVHDNHFQDVFIINPDTKNHVKNS